MLLEAKRRNILIFLSLNITYNSVFRAEDVSTEVSACNQQYRVVNHAW